MSAMPTSLPHRYIFVCRLWFCRLLFILIQRGVRTEPIAADFFLRKTPVFALKLPPQKVRAYARKLICFLGGAPERNPAKNVVEIPALHGGGRYAAARVLTRQARKLAGS